MRLFFAVQIPAEAVERILAVQSDLRGRLKGPGVKWTRPENLHYTLKFLGEQTGARTLRADESAAEAAPGTAAFEMAVSGLGAFPNDERPSILWLGASAGGDQLASLADGLDAALSRRRFPRERRPVKAHLTLARVVGYAEEETASRILRLAQVGEVARFAVTDFVLMQSILHPTGPEYQVLKRYPLSAAPAAQREEGTP